MKAAVYASTRNRYEDMLAPMHSLLAHSDVDIIYFLIEDDVFPYDLPDKVVCINVSGQQWFKPNSPNYQTNWSYMVLLRAAFTKLFPQLDKIIQFDLDTIVNQDISDLWDIPVEGYYIAGAREPRKSVNGTLYINAGVSIWNLKEMRKDKADDALIKHLNEFYFNFPDQDAMYQIFQSKILEIPADYNVCPYTANYKQAKIYHFAANKNYHNFEIVNYYKNFNGKKNDYIKGLDIIIPHYNNLQGLRKTLDSIYNNNLDDVSITVVDDCSTVSLDYIKQLYPNVIFHKLKHNSGPGVARQYGIDHTNKEYIMFIDSGDYSSVESIKIIRQDIQNNIPCLYSYEWFNEENQKKCYAGGTLLHGHVFKRSFLDLYKIRFNDAASYSNEDRGFLYPCKMILKSLQQMTNILLYSCREQCVLNYEYNKNSLVHSNDYMFKRHIEGFCNNMEYMFETCKKYKINKVLIMDEAAKSIVHLYINLMSCAKERPQYYQYNVEIIKKFYFKCIRPYIYMIFSLIQSYYNSNLKVMLELTSPIILEPNLQIFFDKILEGGDIGVRFDNPNIQK